MRGVVRSRGPRYFVASVSVLLFFHKASCVSAQDLSVVGTQQQTNERIRSLGSTAAKSGPHDYAIGNGDLLNVSVFDVPELSRDVRVSQSGTIGIPLVPTRLHVAGLTESQAEQLIADVLQAQGLVSHPEVGVIVKEHKSNPITIVGAVAHPMVYEADHRVTLLEALAQAGGVSNDAGDNIIVTRGHAPSFILVPNPEPVSTPAPGAAASMDNSEGPAAGSDEAKPAANSPAFPSATESAQATAATATASNDASGAPSGNIMTINLNELIEKGDTRNNILLQPGDIVTVPHAGIVYVLGAVNRPGGFVVSNDRTQLTTMKILALAGGVKNIAKLDHAVIIRKDDQGKQTETEVDLKKVLNQKSEDLQMRPSDILYIPDSHTKQFLLTVATLALAIAAAAAIYRIGYQ